MRILELFFGIGSFSRVALEFDCEVVGVDIEPCPKDLTDKIEFFSMDVLEFQYKKYKKKEFGFLWSSPPCETYSTAAFGTGCREKGRAVSEKAILHDSFILRTLDIIEHLEPDYSVIENPRALLRKQDFMQGIPRVTVCYCQYDDDRMKPTDLFGRLPRGFRPKMCRNDNPFCDHERAPRGGGMVGTQARSKDLRAQVPSLLCRELIQLALKESKDPNRKLTPNIVRTGDQSTLTDFFEVYSNE